MKAKLLTKLMTTALVAASLPGPAAVASVTQPQRMIALAPVRDYSRGMDFAAIQPIESLRTVQKEDIARVIPNDLRPNSSGSEVASKIIDHSISSFWNSPVIRNSDFGRTAHQVEKTMDGEAAFGGKEQNSIRHVVKFQMRAAQAKALLEYSGLTNAQLTYSMNQSKFDFEVNEKLASNTRVVFNHIAKPGEQIDMLSLRWRW